MKKIYLCSVFLALFLASCQNTITEEKSTMSIPSSSAESTSAIIWAEEGEWPGLDENGFRTIGIMYMKVDFSKPDGFWVRDWDKRGFAAEPRSDLSQILGQKIAHRYEAAHIAYKILTSEQEAGSNAKHLMQIQHDQVENIWIFGYIGDAPGSGFSVAIKGEPGELIRMWTG